MQTQPAPLEKKVARPDSLGLGSVALARLIEEVRNHAVSAPTAYDRVHNRHNR
jgi:hypothetical protein